MRNAQDPPHTWTLEGSHGQRLLHPHRRRRRVSARPKKGDPDYDRAGQTLISEDFYLSETSLKDLTKKAQRETVANFTLAAASPDLLNALDWITRCASINGPAGTKACIISDRTMRAAQSAVAKALGADDQPSKPLKGPRLAPLPQVVRSRHGLTQQRLADLVQTSLRNVENWEAGLSFRRSS